MLVARFYEEILGNYVQAGSQSCSPAVLEQLSYSDMERIRRRVAENPKTPIDVLERLSSDPCADVRIAVGTNPSTPGHISYGLAFDQDPNVRLGLAEDISTPVELLDKLAEDENPYISCRASQTRALILAGQEPKHLECHRFFRWASQGCDQPEPRYA